MLSSHSLSLAAAVAGFGSAPKFYDFQHCQRYGFCYYQLTKCGCTFTKNLINHIDQRAASADPIKTSWNGTNGIAFAIIRNPIDRFLSLYFDKLTDQNSAIGRHFSKRGLLVQRPRTVSDHQQNTLQTLGHINTTITTSKRLPNFHWRPQIHRLHKISKLDVHLLTLDGLNWQLPLLMKTACPDMATYMKQVGRKNVSPKPCDPDALKTQRLRRQISRIYADDERVYCEVNRHWAKIGTRLGAHGKDIKQTARGWLVTDRQARRHHIQRCSEQGQMGA